MKVSHLATKEHTIPIANKELINIILKALELTQENIYLKQMILELEIAQYLDASDKLQN